MKGSELKANTQERKKTRNKWIREMGIKKGAFTRKKMKYCSMQAVKSWFTTLKCTDKLSQQTR